MNKNSIMNKKNYTWFNAPNSNIDGYPLWLSAANQEDADNTLKVIKRAIDLDITTSNMKDMTPDGKSYRIFNIVLN